MKASWATNRQPNFPRPPTGRSPANVTRKAEETNDGTAPANSAALGKAHLGGSRLVTAIRDRFMPPSRGRNGAARPASGRRDGHMQCDEAFRRGFPYYGRADVAGAAVWLLARALSPLARYPFTPAPDAHVGSGRDFRLASKRGIHALIAGQRARRQFRPAPLRTGDHP